MAGKGRRSLLAIVAFAAGLCATAAPVAAAPVEAGGCGGPAGGARILLTVDQVRSGSGQVVATLYPDDARRFLAKGAKLSRLRAPATSGATKLCLNAPGPGVYALAIYHDSDGDKNYDRNAVGVPTEGFGFSNDAPAKFGLPAFSAVRFRIKAGDNAVRVRMRYP